MTDPDGVVAQQYRPTSWWMDYHYGRGGNARSPAAPGPPAGNHPQKRGDRCALREAGHAQTSSKVPVDITIASSGQQHPRRPRLNSRTRLLRSSLARSPGCGPSRHMLSNVGATPHASKRGGRPSGSALQNPLNSPARENTDARWELQGTDRAECSTTLRPGGAHACPLVRRPGAAAMSHSSTRALPANGAARSRMPPLDAGAHRLR